MEALLSRAYVFELNPCASSDHRVLWHMAVLRRDLRISHHRRIPGLATRNLQRISFPSTCPELSYTHIFPTTEVTHTVPLSQSSRSGRHYRQLPVLEGCLGETELQLARCPVARLRSVPEQRSVGTATVGNSRTEPGAAVALVRMSASVARTGEAGAGDGAGGVVLEAAVPVFLADSWHQRLGTTVPMRPSLLADLAVPVRQVADRTVQGLYMMPQLQVVELEST